MKSHHKLYAAVLFLAVVLHYLAVFGLTTKINELKTAMLWLTAVIIAFYVWNVSGFSQDDK